MELKKKTTHLCVNHHQNKGATFQFFDRFPNESKFNGNWFVELIHWMLIYLIELKWDKHNTDQDILM